MYDCAIDDLFGDRDAAHSLVFANRIICTISLHGRETNCDYANTMCTMSNYVSDVINRAQ